MPLEDSRTERRRASVELAPATSPPDVRADRAVRAREALRAFAEHLGLADADAASYEIALQLRREAYAAWRREHCPSAPACSAVYKWYRRWAAALYDAGLSSSYEVPSRPRRYSDEAIVAALHKAAAHCQTGRPLTVDAYDEWLATEAGRGAPPRRYVWDRHGSWAGVLLAAGLDITDDDHGASERALRAFAKDHPPEAEANPEAFLAWTARRGDRTSSIRSIIGSFGTWRNAMTAVGIVSPPRNPSGRVWENAELFDSLEQWAAKEPDSRLTRSAYRAWARDAGAPAPADNVISDRFGSWAAALSAADLVATRTQTRPFEPLGDGIMERALRAFAEAAPAEKQRSAYRYDTWRSAEARWAPGSSTVADHFGPWNAVRAYLRDLS